MSDPWDVCIKQCLNNTLSIQERVKIYNELNKVLSKLKSSKHYSFSDDVLEKREQQLITLHNNIQSETESSQMNIQEQDAILEDMESSLKRLSAYASDIGTEVGDQNAMLEQFQNEIDDTQNELNNQNNKLTRLLNKSHMWKYWCIAFLVVLCIILLFLIMYA
jgi:DNA repair exonuclease SbcCD ATPase subunit